MGATRSADPDPGDLTIREWPLRVGPGGHLVAIVTAPPGAVSAAPPPAVIFLNAGVLHRVGPHRLHVRLARALATRGRHGLRVDLSGIGDSRPVPGAMSFRQSAVADTRAVMDQLAAELGLHRFVLFGLCSGADNALATAAADERVVGLVLLDPPAYPTPRARARALVARLRHLDGAREVATWGARAITRRVRSRLATLRRPAAPAADEPELTGGREVPAPAVYRAQLAALVARRVAILAVFSGALGERYNHRDQLFELFPELRGRIDRAYFPAANHLFTELDAQATLVATVVDWVEQRR